MSILVIGTNKANGTAAIVKNSGITPEGTINITESGTYDVTNYASADVDIEGAPDQYIEKSIGEDGRLTNSANFINLDNVKMIGSMVLMGQYAVVTFPENTELSFGSVETIYGTYACYQAFNACKNLTSVAFPSLTTISGSGACNQMFVNSKELTSVAFPSLTTISGSECCYNMFQYCTGLTSISFPSLTTINANRACNQMFYGCSSLTKASFPVLSSISGTSSLENVLQNCPKLENIEFGGLTSATFASAKNQLSGIVKSTTGSQAPNGCTIHFPSNFDPENPDHTFDASTLSGYPTFGGSSSYIHLAYDLPATE